MNIILFDSECKLCSAWVPFVIKRDPSAYFKFCSVQSPQGQAILKSIGLPTKHFDTMVLLESGVAQYKSEAFFSVTRQLRKPWPVINILRAVPLSIRDWNYDRIASNRYKIFGRLNYCMIPNKEINNRFID